MKYREIGGFEVLPGRVEIRSQYLDMTVKKRYNGLNVKEISG